MQPWRYAGRYAGLCLVFLLTSPLAAGESPDRKADGIAVLMEDVLGGVAGTADWRRRLAAFEAREELALREPDREKRRARLRKLVADVEADPEGEAMTAMLASAMMRLAFSAEAEERRMILAKVIARFGGGGADDGNGEAVGEWVLRARLAEVEAAPPEERFDRLAAIVLLYKNSTAPHVLHRRYGLLRTLGEMASKEAGGGERLDALAAKLAGTAAEGELTPVLLIRAAIGVEGESENKGKNPAEGEAARLARYRNIVDRFRDSGHALVCRDVLSAATRILEASPGDAGALLLCEGLIGQYAPRVNRDVDVAAALLLAACVDAVDGCDGKIRYLDMMLEMGNAERMGELQVVSVIRKKAGLLGDPGVVDRYYDERYAVATSDRRRFWTLLWKSSAMLRNSDQRAVMTTLVDRFVDSRDPIIVGQVLQCLRGKSFWSEPAEMLPLYSRLATALAEPQTDRERVQLAAALLGKGDAHDAEAEKLSAYDEARRVAAAVKKGGGVERDAEEMHDRALRAREKVVAAQKR